MLIEIKTLTYDTGRDSPLRYKVQVWIAGVCFSTDVNTYEAACKLALDTAERLNLVGPRGSNTTTVTL